MQHEVDTYCNWCTWNDPQQIGKGMKDFEIRRKVKTTQAIDRSEYWEESWRLEEKCRHSNSSGRPPANPDVLAIPTNAQPSTCPRKWHTWNFDIHTNHLISARRTDLIIVNNNKKKENLQNWRLCCPGWPLNKTERMWKEG